MIFLETWLDLRVIPEWIVANTPKLVFLTRNCFGASGVCMMSLSEAKCLERFLTLPSGSMTSKLAWLSPE